jgi:hypothetical protein
MRRLFLKAASSTIYLTTSSNRHVGNTQCKNLKLIIWIIGMMCIQISLISVYPFSSY